MTACTPEQNTFARRVFDGIAGDYEGPARVFSLFQYGRWRRSMLSRLQLRPGASVLDVCTGTGLVAIEVAGSRDCKVVGLDLSGGMIEQARRNIEAHDLSHSVRLVKGRAEDLPFADDSFDAVVFTFLLRYVDDPQATLRELCRVLRPGGPIASLEFYVPRGPVLHPLWLLHTRLAMPLGTRLLSPGWREVGAFLGPSISAFYGRHTLHDLEAMWAQAGFCDVQTKRLSLGGAVVMSGKKEASR